MQKNLIFTMAFSILVALFAVLNSSLVTINYLFGSTKSYLSVVILISATLGAIAAYTFNIFGKMKLRKEIKDAKKQITELEKSKVSLEEENTKLATVANQAIIVEKTVQDDQNGDITQ